MNLTTKLKEVLTTKYQNRKDRNVTLAIQLLNTVCGSITINNNGLAGPAVKSGNCL